MKTLEGGYSRNIVLAWRFYLIFQFLWNDRFIMIRKTHGDKSTSLLGREPAIPFLKLTRFNAPIWSSQHHFTLKSVDLIEACKAGLATDEEIIRMWQWFTRYFLLRTMKSGTRDFNCRVSEAVMKCSLLFVLCIVLWVNELE